MIHFKNSRGNSVAPLRGVKFGFARRESEAPLRGVKF